MLVLNGENIRKQTILGCTHSQLLLPKCFHICKTVIKWSTVYDVTRRRALTWRLFGANMMSATVSLFFWNGYNQTKIVNLHIHVCKN